MYKADWRTYSTKREYVVLQTQPSLSNNSLRGQVAHHIHKGFVAQHASHISLRNQFQGLRSPSKQTKFALKSQVGQSDVSLKQLSQSEHWRQPDSVHGAQSVVS